MMNYLKGIDYASLIAPAVSRPKSKPHNLLKQRLDHWEKMIAEVRNALPR